MKKYRFKTEAELLADYGVGWEDGRSCFILCMSHLFGVPLVSRDNKQWISCLSKCKGDDDIPRGFFLKGKYEAPVGHDIAWFMDRTGLIEIEE